MGFHLPRDLRGTAGYRQITELLERALGPGVGGIVDASDLTANPSGDRLACTAWIRWSLELPPMPTVAVLDVPSGRLQRFDPPNGGIRRQPRWAPDGRLLAALEGDHAGPARPILLDPDTGTDRTPAAGAGYRGSVEQLSWSPSGDQLLLQVAEPGAEISDVFGSGRVPGDDGLPDWCPEVSRNPGGGRRGAWVWDIATGRSRPVAGTGNVWELAWVGAQRMAAIASAGPEEDAWYAAHLVLVDLANGARRVLLSDAEQLALPAADPTGTWLTVLAGPASDRGLLAGRLLIREVERGDWAEVDTLRADVTAQQWRDERSVVFSGVRGLECVVGEYDVRDQRTRQLWAGPDAVGPGELLPVACPLGADRAAVVLESHARPPAPGLVRAGRFTPLADWSHSGTAVLAELWSGLRPLHWFSTDGRRVAGYLATPDRPGPHPLIVHVHGGPVWCWRDVWGERSVALTALLSRGFAVLLPNPRGSQGNGAAYARAIVGEVGGRDVADVVSGVDRLVVDGVADGRRVGVIGGSYGGFLSAWLAVTRPDRFAAAVAISPVTDWLSQHYTTNIPQSDVRYLDGGPLDPDSHYRTRSPVLAVTAGSAPVLLTGGALDLATPPGQAIELARALAEHGVDSDVAIYPKEGHEVHEWPALLDQTARLVAWFEHFLGAPG